mgnify:CR=1 FL=1|tara:strand:+ start:296 stop:1003 length:708 start_codon:yes stop_codon:yes gene_type:complete
MKGWIKLHRAILEWEWYGDINVRLVFMHCLLKANHKDRKWQGKTVKRGSFLTGRDVLAEEIGLTVRQVRTALTKLKTTSDVSTISTSKGTLVTLMNYDKFQCGDEETTSETTSDVSGERPANDQQTPTNKNDKKERMVRTPLSTKPKLDLSELDNIAPKVKQSVLEWIEYKTSIKKPMKQPALKKLLKSSPQAIIAAVDASIMNGYQGLFPEKHESKQQQFSTPQHHVTEFLGNE